MEKVAASEVEKCVDKIVINCGKISKIFNGHFPSSLIIFFV